jgi:hypothetical protein
MRMTRTGATTTQGITPPRIPEKEVISVGARNVRKTIRPCCAHQEFRDASGERIVGDLSRKMLLGRLA